MGWDVFSYCRLYGFLEFFLFDFAVFWPQEAAGACLEPSNCVTTSAQQEQLVADLSPKNSFGNEPPQMVLQVLQLMAEILHHLGCMKPYK